MLLFSLILSIKPKAYPLQTSMLPLAVSLSSFYLKKSYYLFCMYTYVCMTSIQVPSEARRGFQITGSWSSIVGYELPDVGVGNQTESSERTPKALLTAELSLRPLIYFFEMGSYCVVQASLHLRVAHLSFWSSRLTDTHHAQLSNIELLFTVDKAHLYFCVFCYNSCIK